MLLLMLTSRLRSPHSGHLQGGFAARLEIRDEEEDPAKLIKVCINVKQALFVTFLEFTVIATVIKLSRQKWIDLATAHSTALQTPMIHHNS